MSKKIAIELNCVDLLKHVLYKDYTFPEVINHLNLTQERILMTVRNSDHLPMVTIARAIGLEKGPFSQTVDKLVDLNLLSRVKSTIDKRLVFLELTQKGEELTQLIEDSMELHFSKKLNALTVSQVNDFFNALEVLNKTATILISK
ncbi:MarR family winged helix-turn-helix transcriptional regulator [Flavobacterium sp. I3-2]|uniref:MarR family winged helix-turn-helix transcriptional regulator n=1 Tax=Flavobacterium sp. I3-2 TaxID=2748319 RepID=UPI0015A88580|nr:MarR family transcriptional regulator [Flavobacterium sp. I3-2]